MSILGTIGTNRDDWLISYDDEYLFIIDIITHICLSLEQHGLSSAMLTTASSAYVMPVKWIWNYCATLQDALCQFVNWPDWLLPPRKFRSPRKPCIFISDISDFEFSTLPADGLVHTKPRQLIDGQFWVPNVHVINNSSVNPGEAAVKNLGPVSI